MFTTSSLSYNIVVHLYIVTVVGMSAGGASVHYLLLSPNSAGLFHRAVSFSGQLYLYTCSWLPITLLCNLNLSFSFQLLHIHFLAYKCRQLSYLFNPFSLCPCFFSDFFNLFSLLLCFAFLPIFSYIFLFAHSHPLPVSLSLALIHRLANHNLCHIRDA